MDGRKKKKTLRLVVAPVRVGPTRPGSPGPTTTQGIPAWCSHPASVANDTRPIRLLRASARPITRGRRTQLWEAVVTDADGRTVATGRVRLLALEPEATVAGESVVVKAAVRRDP